MKKLLLAAALTSASFATYAVSPGGPGCGWGNALFEGTDGPAPHIAAATTNGTSGNATFGMTSGTNGCATDASITYGGKSFLAMKGAKEEVAQDMAVGEGDALNALAFSIGVDKQDREHFNAVMHENFAKIFTSSELTAKEIAANIDAVMAEDSVLNQYV